MGRHRFYGAFCTSNIQRGFFPFFPRLFSFFPKKLLCKIIIKFIVLFNYNKIQKLNEKKNRQKVLKFLMVSYVIKKMVLRVQK